MEKSPFSKDEIAIALTASFQAVNAAVSETQDAIFLQRPNNKWSIAEQLQHLIQSNFPVASALKRPPERLATFGQPDQPTRTYDQLRALYMEVLKGGLKAGGSFIPVVNPEDQKAVLLQNWNNIDQKFQERLAEWPEQEMDQYVIPHPAIGKFSLREMLFFTIFHNLHHLKSIKSIPAKLTN